MDKVLMQANRKYRLDKIEKIYWDMFFERNKLLITLLTILFVGIVVLLHQTGIVVMKP